MNEDDKRFILTGVLLQIAVVLVSAALILTEMGALKESALLLLTSAVTLSLSTAVESDGIHRTLWGYIGVEI